MGRQAETSADLLPLARQVDVVVVGAGFAGLNMLRRLRMMGMSAQGFEAAPDVGGTWYWNRYPGARCDVESLDYSYSFSDELQQEWDWSERYAGQPEILAYINHVADRFDLRRDIRFDTRVSRITYDDTTPLWTVGTDRGDRVSARFCVMATGCLSLPRKPDFPGLGDFRGAWYHTGDWPREDVDFAGRRVGVIGTGSSGVQSIPKIAERAEHVLVFQRTPHYILPAGNGKLDPDHVQSHKARYAEHRAAARNTFGGIVREAVPTGSVLDATPDERRETFDRLWKRGGTSFLKAYADYNVNIEANTVAADYIRERIREVVTDPAVAKLLSPTSYPVGTKRIVLDTNYYQTFNRPNVTLVNVLSDPIQTITPEGLRTRDRGYTFDTLVFATGYDAMTGSLLAMDIRGRGGRSLRDAWVAGPRTYLGLMTSGFPNLFMVAGPGSPSVLMNMVLATEQHVDWIAACIAYMARQGAATIEADPAAEDDWVGHVNEVAEGTLYKQANSWYLGANVPGKPRVFMPYVGGFQTYRVRCDAVAEAGYAGFTLRPSAA